jgi:hypothetical protein
MLLFFHLTSTVAIGVGWVLLHRAGAAAASIAADLYIVEVRFITPQGVAKQ